MARTSPIEESHWEKEKELPPPVSLLEWLVRNPPSQFEGSLGSSEFTVAKRKALLKGDQQVRDEALRLLRTPPPPSKAWYILEGPSYPDVFIKTADVILVVEGKRTEAKPTRKTSWMTTRDQLLRHIDCAWEIRGGRRVYGMMIVEGNGGEDAVQVPPRWLEWVADSRRNPVLKNSLPHRSENERHAIAAAVLGVTTWQRVCREFGIDWNSLPDLWD